jgi:MarR family transcriptional regulator, organic hydroperoxide resistance regulator
VPARDQRLYHRAQLAAHAMKKAADRQLTAAAGITTSQAAVLAVTATDPPVLQTHVAARLGLNESAITAMVTRLTTLGHLRRDRSDADGRAWVLRLTDRGRRCLARADTAFSTVNRTIDATLTAEEVDRLADYLTRLRQAFT